DHGETAARNLVDHSHHAAAVIGQSVAVDHHRKTAGRWRFFRNHQGHGYLRLRIGEDEFARVVALDVPGLAIEKGRCNESAGSDDTDLVVSNAAGIIETGPFAALLIANRGTEPLIERRMSGDAEYDRGVRRYLGRIEQQLRRRFLT